MRTPFFAISIALAMVAFAQSGCLGQQCVELLPPEDAVVLFDGTDCGAWRMGNKPGECAWRMEDGALIATDTGNLATRDELGDAQIHLEFVTCATADGNSGVYVQGSYEVQVLNSHGRPPYNNGCGAIYAAHAPMVNASLPAGEWQSFDIVFRAPTYDTAGNRYSRARMTVIHNGIVIHDAVEFDPTPGGMDRDPGRPGPLMLQWHGAPVKYRNIWYRPLDGPSSEGR